MSSVNEDATVIMSTSLVGRPLGEILVAKGKVSEENLMEALALQKEKEMLLGELLVEKQFISDADVSEALAIQLGMRFEAEIDSDSIDPALVGPFSLAYARQHNFVPLRKTDRRLMVAVSNPLALFGLDDLRAVFHCEIVPIVAPPEQIFDAINVVFDRRAGAEQVVDEVAGDESDEIATELEEATRDILDASDDEAPIIRLVNSVLNQAIKEMVSDIHIEPYEKEIVIRFRQDGVLREIVRAPKRLQATITSRIKIMGDLNIAEKRLPQDGRIRVKIAGRDVDIRLSTVPTAHGERLVLRLLDTSAAQLDLSALGFSPDNLKTIEGLVARPHGVMLVTGPTGSGKTTTLYAALTSINRPEINILTIEDPVEYQLEGIGQMQVNSKIDFTFARGLRAILRQDPDVVLIGEIRDIETAEIAIQASLTGHLVLATLHTNDAATSFTRLTDMGVEPFLIGSSVVACLAQRLVRTLCKKCRQAYKPPKHELEQLGMEAGFDEIEFYRAGTCDTCTNGYTGRVGIYEMLPVDDEIKSLVVSRAEASRIKRKAIENGMRTLRDDGALKVYQGITTVDEVMRVTAEEMN